MPQNQRIRAHTKIPKIDRKIHKNHSSQEKEIDATMNASIQPEVRFSTKLWRKSSLQRKGIRKQSRSMRRHLTKELYIWSLSRCGKWPSYPYNSNEDAHPSVELWSKLGISHQVATPSPQFASSQCKPCDPTVCPLTSKLLGVPEFRLPPVLVLWLNKATRRFFGEPPQTLCADSGCELLPYTDSSPRLRFALFATIRPGLDLVRPPGPSRQAYLSQHSSEAPQG
jgi:hypothetical protein